MNTLRIYPKMRYYWDYGHYKDDAEFDRLNPHHKKCTADTWCTLSLKELKTYFNFWWPQLKAHIVKDHLESHHLDNWFRERYLIAIDHTIYKNGRWQSGFNKEGNLT